MLMKSAREVGGPGRVVADVSVDRVLADRVGVGEAGQVGLGGEDESRGHLDDVAVRILVQILDEEGWGGFGLDGYARVDGLAVDDADPREAAGLVDAHPHVVEGRVDDVDGVSGGDEHSDSVSVEVDALV